MAPSLGPGCSFRECAVKILLIGNYAHSHQQSMQRFAALMRELLTAAGHELRLLKPEPLLGNLKPGEAGLSKWLGYVDRFVLFRWRLRRADVVHVCDHGNAMYAGMLGGRPNVVTCHDLLAVQSALGEVPGNVTGFSGRIFQRWIVSGLRRAQHVVCVSEQTRSEPRRLSGLPAARCSMVPNALNYPYRPMAADEARERLRAPSLRQLVQWYFPADRDAGVLDLGYGHSALIHFARQLDYCNVHGVDGSPEQVAAARSALASKAWLKAT